ncbi:hypothetical protein A3Q56_06124 [Intoshia linei]|uniref:Uncharacterized protein n=1 Tax=Intoshia linei TaxID=1819745 RepID=A0A177AX88_9BILA|nr:hypothetical protein A3Q56_06124 [Intoshia linei]
MILPAFSCRCTFIDSWELTTEYDVEITSTKIAFTATAVMSYFKSIEFNWNENFVLMKGPNMLCLGRPMQYGTMWYFIRVNDSDFYDYLEHFYYEHFIKFKPKYIETEVLYEKLNCISPHLLMEFKYNGGE